MRCESTAHLVKSLLCSVKANKEMSDRKAAVDFRMRAEARAAKENSQQESTQPPVTMTTGMRDLRLKHMCESDLQDTRHRIESYKQCIDDLEKEFKYTEVAYKVLGHYADTNNLDLRLTKRTICLDPEMPGLEATEIEFKPEDEGLLNTCLKRYGFEIVEYEEDNGKQCSKFQLGLVSTKSP